MPPHRNGEGNAGHTLPISNRSASRDLFIASWTARKSIEGGSSSGGGLRSETGAQRAFRADNQAAHARDWNLSFADLPVDLALIKAEVCGNRLHAGKKIVGEIGFNVCGHSTLR